MSTPFSTKGHLERMGISQRQRKMCPLLLMWKRLNEKSCVIVQLVWSALRRLCKIWLGILPLQCFWHCPLFFSVLMWGFPLVFWKWLTTGTSLFASLNNGADLLTSIECASEQRIKYLFFFFLQYRTLIHISLSKMQHMFNVQGPFSLCFS